MARPAKEPTINDCDRIELLAMKGATLDQIAALCDISPSTLDRWRKLPEVAEAYNRGRAVAITDIAGALYTIAIDGNVTACIFWLKSQAGWTDKPQPEQQQQAEIHIYLPDDGRGGASD
jgi:Homeodomain-like domain